MRRSVSGVDERAMQFGERRKTPAL